MTGEGSHEKGREGLLATKQLLWRMWGDAIDLPFAANTHPDKLKFEGSQEWKLSSFSFDLAGRLGKSDPTAFSSNTSDVFVEVKNYAVGSSLLAEYEAFLKKAAYACTQAQHAKTCFMFVSTAAFGTSQGTSLCDGTYLKEKSRNWPKQGQSIVDDLIHRICLVFATPSLSKFVAKWPPHRGAQ